MPPEPPEPPGPPKPPGPPPLPPLSQRPRKAAVLGAPSAPGPAGAAASPPDLHPGATTAPLAVVFDLDGTLIDSRRDIAAAVNAMRAERGLAPLGVAEVDRMVGEGARMLVRRALPAGAGGEAFKAAVASYRAHYAEVCLDTTRPFPGIAVMLAALAAALPLAVLSNKSEASSRRILKELGLDRYLREVVGGDTLPTRKPNPGGLYLLADRLSVPAQRLLLVGDSWVDADTARAAGCLYAAALWGAADAADAADADAVGTARPAEAAGGPGAGAAAAGSGLTAAGGWRFARPHDLAAALGLAENGENGENGEDD